MSRALVVRQGRRTMAIASSLLLVLLLLTLSLRSSAAQSHITNISAAVRDSALEALRRTDQLIGVPLPENVTGGLQATALRVRSNNLWADGVVDAAAAGTAGISVPPRVIPAPFSRRVVVVFERFLGGSSRALFAAPRGYALAAPVVALLAYDAAEHNGRRIALRALGAPVRVEFNDLSSEKGFNATTARCLTFASSGKTVATHAMVSGAVCAVSGTGHYGVAVLLEPPPPPPPPTPVRERWWAWTVVAGAGGLVAISCLAVSIAGVVRWSRRRRREEMDLMAMAEEELGRMAVRGSRMPAAKMVRTQPEIDDVARCHGGRAEARATSPASCTGRRHLV